MVEENQHKKKEAYLQELLNKISLADLRKDYCEEFLSERAISEKYNVTRCGIKKLISQFDLHRDIHIMKSKSNTEVKNRQYLEIKNNITKDILYDYYILQDHGYYESIKYFNLSEWTFDRLLKDYSIKKDRKKTGKKGVITRYKKAGGKDNYLNEINQKTTETRIKKYGSMENYIKYISSACSNNWNNKSEGEKKEINQKTMEHGGGWNKETILKTLSEKYNVDNAYKLANNYQSNSKVNQIFADKLDEEKIIFSREIYLGSNRYDFKVDNKFIEINPWPFHNTSWCPLKQAKLIHKDYHLEKTKNALEYGMRCIHVWDWDNQYKIINLLKNRDKVFARNCEIKNVSKEIAKNYINKYHLQNYAKDEIRIGLHCGGELIGIMTFGKPRYNKKYEWELIRYCSSKNIIGGSEKLFNYFIKNYNPESIVSYCDLSKFKGDSYIKLGFKNLRNSPPGKHWYNIKTGLHITDNLLRQRGFDQLIGKYYGCFGKDYSNMELMRAHGFVEIYDCGQSTYVWLKNHEKN